MTVRVPDPARATAAGVRTALAELADPKKAAVLQRFFKTGRGGYGEGDTFLGITVPRQRAVARRFRDLPLDEAVVLLASATHEHRLTALLIMVERYRRSDDAGRTRVVDAYLANRRWVNNWDLVDSSAPYILGHWLRTQDRRLLRRLARSPSVWDRRIAMLATYAFIKDGDETDAMAIAKQLIADEHELIHKAVGWMLREVGKRVGLAPLRGFLRQHASDMPRTALRYAIERMSADERSRWLRRGAEQQSVAKRRRAMPVTTASAHSAGRRRRSGRALHSPA